MFFDQATSISELRDTICHLVLVGRLSERAIVINGQLMGTVIGTAASIQAYTDVQLALFLTKPLGVAPTPVAPIAGPADIVLDHTPLVDLSDPKDQLPG